MVDFNAYKQLHSHLPSYVASYSMTGRESCKEMAVAVMKDDNPPQGSELYILPNTMVGYNLRQKKWSM